MIKVLISSIFLGIGLAMDACAVSMANGLNEPKMKFRKTLFIAIMFGLFQGAMPLIGYLVGCQILTKIDWIIPWAALIILGYLGGKMIYDGIKGEEECDAKSLTLKVIFVQTIATSIDALSVGFTISNYKLLEALVCVGCVAITTFGICLGAVYVGKKFGTRLGNKAILIGGIILSIIGIEIFISGIFF